METETKTCSKCGAEKLLGEFYKNRTRKDGLTKECKSCRKDMDKSRYEAKDPVERRAAYNKWINGNPKNRERIRAAKRALYKAQSSPETRAIFNAKRKELYKANPDKYRATAREWHRNKMAPFYKENPEVRWAHTLWRDHKMTPEQWYAMLETQGGKCANPNCTNTGNDCKHGRLVVDHCHATELRRCLLCDGCNLARGHMKEDAYRTRGLSDLMYRQQGLPYGI